MILKGESAEEFNRKADENLEKYKARQKQNLIDNEKLGLYQEPATTQTVEKWEDFELYDVFETAIQESALTVVTKYHNLDEETTELALECVRIFKELKGATKQVVKDSLTTQTVEARVSQMNDKVVCDSNNAESDRQMKSTELRVGNFVSVDGKNLPVTQIFEKGLNCGNVGALYELVKPIPLTEEWLEQFGFEKVVYDSEKNGYGIEYHLKKKDLFIEIYSDMSLNLYDSDKDTDNDLGVGVHPKHVHQLQNLYFALTSEELKQNKEDETISS